MLVWDSILSTRAEGDGGRGIVCANERVVRGVRVARAKGSESELEE